MCGVFCLIKQGEKSSAPAKAVAFCSAKQGEKSSAPAKAVAFCSAKQGGFHEISCRQPGNAKI
ncbi:hypothetical protein DWZ31_00585 [Roseburia intestinalis]|jgi:hypothetical protein|uniref:Uncharacterized protein n=2 Tax=Roseburia intestinalis TaxID=166486 RepID=A0A3R6H456_9FIRM|nr:hypothetical protein ROSINTL182_09299 [Roseburia intestinalis L1-82]MBD9182842.1 hypothetical protein [Roseburia intestinalis]RHN11982.1 hypothetical protein DWZ31_00585 [Roseburia intestinalis]